MTITTGLQTERFGSAPANIHAAVRSASVDSGVDFSYLMAKAAVESGFRADAKAPTSSATGLYQFIESTWLDMVRRHGGDHGLEAESAALQAGKVDGATRRDILALRNDPKLAAAMAAEYTRENVEHLKRTVGGSIGATEQYMAHFLGAGGAEQFLKGMRANPDQPAAEILPAAARSNPSIFYRNGTPRSIGQVYDHFAAKFDAPAAYAVADAGAGSPAARSPGEEAPTQGASPARMLARSGGVPMPAEGSSPLMLSPSSYAAKLFMATLVLPGETAGRGAGSLT